MCVHRVRLATAGLATQRGDTERERAWPNIDQAALLSSCQMARSALQFRARSARTCKIRTGKGERSEPAGKNHTAADPQVSSVHLRSALIRGAKTRPGGLDPHWHRQTAKKIGSYNRNSPVPPGRSHERPESRLRRAAPRLRAAGEGLGSSLAPLYLPCVC